jgi:four helix bundle protein
MNYEEWLSSVPATITDDALWQTAVYRQALFLGDLCWYDISKLVKDRRTVSLSDQLYRAAGGISANIAEGYSRASEKDQARFYEYALGSSRESRDWYFKGRFVLGQMVVEHRMGLLVHIIRQLAKMVPKYRGKYISEESASYQVEPLAQFLQIVPMPEE